MNRSNNYIRIKICCISSVAEAFMAMSVGADALGLVSAMPSGPGIISEIEIKRIAESVPKNIFTFLLTSFTNAKDIISQLQFTETTTVQIVDKIPITELHLIKKALPLIRLVYVIHVLDESSIAEAELYSTAVDALLLDSGKPNATLKTLGGTGQTHNWEISRQIVETVGCPVFLAGGLHAGNVKEAIHIVQPFGVDICSGVRTDGRLDPEKLTQFVAAIRG